MLPQTVKTTFALRMRWFICTTWRQMRGSDFNIKCVLLAEFLTGHPRITQSRGREKFAAVIAVWHDIPTHTVHCHTKKKKRQAQPEWNLHILDPETSGLPRHYLRIQNSDERTCGSCGCSMACGYWPYETIIDIELASIDNQNVIIRYQPISPSKALGHQTYIRRVNSKKTTEMYVTMVNDQNLLAEAISISYETACIHTEDWPVDWPRS